jgi:hypothetical protein
MTPLSIISHCPLVDPLIPFFPLSLSLLPPGLAKIVHVAATFGMVVGSELHERAVLPKDHYIIQAFINSAVRCFLQGNEATYWEGAVGFSHS